MAHLPRAKTAALATLLALSVLPLPGRVSGGRIIPIPEDPSIGLGLFDRAGAPGTRTPFEAEEADPRWKGLRAELTQSLRKPEPPLLDTFSFPLRNWKRISSTFGVRVHPVLKRRLFHRGWDVPAQHGSPVFAARSGRVVFSGWKNGYGELIEIRHLDGKSTLYGHLSARLVKTGDWVNEGDSWVGLVGDTGLATGSHLHFELRNNDGRPIDPDQVVRLTVPTESATR